MTRDPKCRHLRLEGLADLRSELKRIEQADQEGRLETTGQWTAGQILAHLAAWIEYGYEGYPMRKPSLLLRPARNGGGCPNPGCSWRNLRYRPDGGVQGGRAIASSDWTAGGEGAMSARQPSFWTDVV
jgi:hypothetical protein